MSSDPLISCIMPTMAGREAFRAEAIDCLKAQTYENWDLVVIGEPGSIGAKRNQACSQAAGEIICHWDDDDWSAPGRLRDQVDRLIDSGLELTGYHSMLFRDEEDRWWRYCGSSNYALGTSLCYFKALWRRRPFQDRNEGEDNQFISGLKISSVDAGDLMWARIHRGNTSDKAAKLGKASNWIRIK